MLNLAVFSMLPAYKKCNGCHCSWQLALCPVRGTGGRDKITRFAGTSFKPRKLPGNAVTPITMAPALFAGDRVHTVLGRFCAYQNDNRSKERRLRLGCLALYETSEQRDKGDHIHNAMGKDRYHNILLPPHEIGKGDGKKRNRQHGIGLPEVIYGKQKGINKWC